MADTFDHVAHLAPAVAVPHLEEAGAETIIEFHDVLSHGPSALDPKEHREGRLDYWRGLYERVIEADAEETDLDIEGALEELADSYLSTEQLGSIIAHRAESRRIVVWTTPAFQDRLLMWMAFDAAMKADVPVEQIATAEPRIPSPDGEIHLPLRDLGGRELIAGFDEIVYPKEIYVEAGAQLWQTFTSASPRKFAISIPHTEKFFPDIETLGERYGWMFPRQHGEDSERIWPSAFDAELLSALDRDRWQTPLEVLGADFVEQFYFVDDLAVVARLREWAEQDEEMPYVRSRETDRDELFERRAFQLTERGESLVDEGFDAEDDAPVLELGNARIYAGDRPWVKVVEGEYWWFERFERE